MPPKVQQKTKEQKLAAAMAGGKSKKKKWSKGKMREKVANKVLFDEEMYTNRLLTEIPKSKLITPSALVERLKINGSLARAALRELKEKGLIKPVSVHHSQIIYTRATAAAE
ncbi:hypothetical protein NSK_007629 [Nannochloropsis salina CCMP1776]|uniref:40S ribosomal protein S25 n=2 Tax=Monodopsidaceae TaxID=425072 RepID=W7TVF9_9STRA|nr:ribosomal protein s25 [Nannochloropsis gaditana]TFJ80986.1 hypothetical protein NSK_007629 [Nannochloropsis salina CCMP1776]|eukprot:TFJ80986.1 hypothetical protein NSK_007629 [Nannochloropsis salina CCMP1776]